MLYNYKALEQGGAQKSGSIEAVSLEVAIDSLQKRGLIIAAIDPAEKETWLSKLSLGEKVTTKDVVILSRQMATLFNASVSALKIFSLLASEAENQHLRRSLIEITDDLQAGSSISKALGKHPEIFSDFYVNMVKSGEETGKLNETFEYLADHLDRNYEVVSKAKNALIYPAFVIAVFIAVMILMFTVIIPKISVILLDSGQPVPFYTAVVFAFSNFILSYGILILAALLVFGFFFFRFLRTEEGSHTFARFKLSVPYLGTLYKKLYLSVITDNLSTMIISGIPMVRSLEVTANVVGNDVYRNMLEDSVAAVKGGSSLSQSLSQYEEMPAMLIQMVKVGEETGELGSILKTMARFYQREVVNAVDTLVGLIEPVMIVALGLGVGTLLASVLIPIYNIANSAGA
ncbi:type II secretion system F family protein [Candidatus Parcubacteria bacterium]|nr:type II secretion system F family protein [Candidatus Parcubacteria bacterium]